jgi:catechol 2,3-dioxygenase-like lactoylglutathione lyase family enzyme
MIPVVTAALRVDQVGIIVRDLDAALPRYERLLGAGPWRLWAYGPSNLSEQMYRGKRAAYAMRLALSSSRPQVELIEATAGPSVYDDWLDRNSTGLHHLGSIEEDLDAGIARMAAAGFEVLQLGRGYGLDGDGGFAYFDTVAELGVMLELINVPARRREPDAIWPAHG